MIQKKSPRCLAAVGAGKKDGKVADLAYPHDATPPRPSQSECCSGCQFFRAVFLPYGRGHLLCMLTGEKLRTAAGWCAMFAPGHWAELRTLTCGQALGMVKTPNQVRRHTRLSCLPRVGKSRVTSSAVKAPAGRMPGGLLSHIGRVVTSSIREDWRLHLSRGALRPAFSIFHHPKSSEAPMHFIPFFRPASCGGRASLSSLFRKLVRAGKTAALVALLGISARLCREMFHNIPTMQEVRP